MSKTKTDIKLKPKNNSRYNRKNEQLKTDIRLKTDIKNENIHC